jgi:hypothetical protein
MSVHEYQQQPDLFTSLDRRPPVERGDITSRKSGSPATSAAANARVNKDADNGRILEMAKRDGVVWLAEAARRMRKDRNCISGRFTWLAKNEFLVETGEIREGCRCFRWSGK